jgi:hypothetical protein
MNSITKHAVKVINNVLETNNIPKSDAIFDSGTGITKGVELELDTNMKLTEFTEHYSSLEKLKVVALTTALITQQESLTVTRIVEDKNDKDNVYRGLSLSVGEKIDLALAKEIKSIVDLIDPELNFSTHGEDIRFINFDKKANQEFIRNVREIASELPVDAVVIKRFQAEGFKIENNFQVHPKGQNYVKELSDLGYESTATLANSKRNEVSTFIQEKGWLRDPDLLKKEPAIVKFKHLKKEDQIPFDFEFA